MTDEEKLSKIRKLVADYYEPKWLDPEKQPTSEWSMGNYDDVFSDGIRLGGHWLAQDIVEILDPREPS